MAAAGRGRGRLLMELVPVNHSPRGRVQYVNSHGRINAHRCRNRICNGLQRHPQALQLLMAIEELQPQLFVALFQIRIEIALGPGRPSQAFLQLLDIGGLPCAKGSLRDTIAQFPVPISSVQRRPESEQRKS
jgi:hypothetical protein